MLAGQALSSSASNTLYLNYTPQPVAPAVAPASLSSAVLPVDMPNSNTDLSGNPPLTTSRTRATSQSVAYCYYVVIYLKI